MRQKDDGLDVFFAGRPDARRIFDAVRQSIVAIGDSTMRVTKSQVAFSRGRAFAWAWTPDRYLRGAALAPLVISVALVRRDASSRWKQIVEPTPGRWMHHLELFSTADVDEQVERWLEEAWAEAQ